MLKGIDKGQSKVTVGIVVVIVIIAGAAAFMMMGGEEGAGPTPGENELTKYEKAAIEAAENMDIPTVLSEEKQKEVFLWYAHASKPYRGVKIKTIAQAFPYSVFMGENVASVFEKITGIDVVYNTGGNEEVYNKAVMEAETGSGEYQFFFDDQDMLGTWLRRGLSIKLDVYREEHPDVSSPYYDWEDVDPFAAEYRGPEDHLYDIPCSSAPALGVYRTDLLENEQYQQEFEQEYGYEMPVPPKTWEKLSDLAEFFDGKEEGLSGVVPVCGAQHPCTGYTFLDLFFRMGGVGSADTEGLSSGFPATRPVTSGWGIKVEDGVLQSAKATNGGMVNSEAAINTVRFYRKLVKNYSPEGVESWTYVDSADSFLSGKGAVLPVLWSQLIVPRAADPKKSAIAGDFEFMMPPINESRWEEGKAKTYMDGEGFMIPYGASEKEKAAAWLFLQFGSSKATKLWQALNNGNITRMSTITSDTIMKKNEEWGGYVQLVRDIYQTRSNPDKATTVVGTDWAIGDYPAILEESSSTLHDAIWGDKPAKYYLDKLANDIDELLKTLGYPKMESGWWKE